MPKVNVKVSCPVVDSFRVSQVSGLFDMKVSARAEREWSVMVPDLSEEWQIGAIVGPSGSGKSVVARHHYGDKLIEHFDWPQKKAVVDGFDESLSIKDITGAFNSVGFSSPPDWIKPYSVLSNGQRFRCDLARALLTASDVAVYDEFTSVVDRQVAKFGSAAVAKAIRKGVAKNLVKRFVAVTCHYDILEWLQPDWVLDMAAGGRLARGWLQCKSSERQRYGKLVGPRPPIVIRIFRCDHSWWNLFKQHHYLSSDLNRSARCYLAVWDGVPVGFCAMMPLVAKANRWRISRTVVLPDYQGMGIGVKLSEAMGELYLRRGLRVNATASHPALIGHRNRSPLWKLVAQHKFGVRASGIMLEGNKQATTSFGRGVASFEYVGNR